MPTIEERVAYLEGTVGGHTHAFAALQDAVGAVRAGVTELRTDMNARFAQIDQRFLGVESRLSGIDRKVDRQFVALMGTQLAVLLAVIAALAGAYYR